MNITEQWLNARFSITAGKYRSHAPINGLTYGDREFGYVERVLRLNAILYALSDICDKTKSVLEVGAAEGWASFNISREFGCKVTATDISEEACNRARELFGVESVKCDVQKLPFSDGQFDIAVCSETLEHVDDPQTAIMELLRVARTCVITVPNESPAKIAKNSVSIVPHVHKWSYNAKSFDYLKDLGYSVHVSSVVSLPIWFVSSVLERIKKLNLWSANVLVGLDMVLPRFIKCRHWVVVIGAKS